MLNTSKVATYCAREVFVIEFCWHSCDVKVIVGVMDDRLQ